MGLFVREATQLNELRRKERITASWLGFNVDKKGLNTILESNKTRSPASKDEEHKRNFNALAARLRQMG